LNYCCRFSLLLLSSMTLFAHAEERQNVWLGNAGVITETVGCTKHRTEIVLVLHLLVEGKRATKAPTNRSLSPTIAAKLKFNTSIALVPAHLKRQHLQLLEGAAKKKKLDVAQTPDSTPPRRLPNCLCARPCTNIFQCNTPLQSRAKKNK
jgi:hypothetical protein